ncbi:MAG: hypothetical protein AAF725_01215 [Acidobacteriota bacterium]
MSVDRDSIAYAQNYCEENVWQLSRHPQLPAGVRYAVFISSLAGRCAMWSQRAAEQPGSPVIWDYHAVLMVESQIFDLDCTAGLPLSLRRYLEVTFPFGNEVDPELRPSFRVIEAGEFRRTFASDRSHMRGADGGWLHPPPEWPAILAPGQTMNLPSFIDMRPAGFGEILDLELLSSRFGG